MNTNYDAIIDSYLENKIGMSKLFLDADLCNQLRNELLQKYKSNQFHKAGIGNKENEQHNNAIRSDEIYWLDRSHDNETENEFLNKMDDFILYLNSTCYTGITKCEFHYAIYEKGSFYGKHKDQFNNQTSRAFSMIHYLNEDWKLKDGGQLCLHVQNEKILIDPKNGTSMFFKSSEIEHEVLLTNTPRLSITGWLRTD